jgi:hypothetical protein
MSREMQSLNPGRRNLLQEVPLMEETPPENKPGFA